MIKKKCHRHILLGLVALVTLVTKELLFARDVEIHQLDMSTKNETLTSILQDQPFVAFGRASISNTTTVLQTSSTVGDFRVSDKTNKHDDESTPPHVSINTSSPLLPPQFGEEPHVLYDKNLKYRRICSHVHTSVLCLILRYPYELPLQQIQHRYPKPINEKFRRLKHSKILELDELDACRSTITTTTTSGTTSTANNFEDCDYYGDDVYNDTNPFWQSVKQCLEMYASKDRITVFGVFTRMTRVTSSTSTGTSNARSSDSEQQLPCVTWDYFGTGERKQKERVYRFFYGQKIILFGASPTPTVTSCFVSLFGGNTSRSEISPTNSDAITTTSTSPCTRIGKNKWECFDIQSSGASGGRSAAATKMDKRKIRIHVVWYHPTMVSREMHDFHSTPDLWNVTYGAWQHYDDDDGETSYNIVNVPGRTRPTSPLRNLTIIYDLPFAHMQSQYMLYNNYSGVIYNTQGYVQYMLNETTGVKGRDNLKNRGWKLQHAVAFDGLPQHFPTESNAYVPGHPTKSIQHGKFPGWKREHGLGCVGPLPTTSLLRQAMLSGRNAFDEAKRKIEPYCC